MSMFFVSPGDTQDKTDSGIIIANFNIDLADYIVYICVGSSAITLLVMAFYHVKTLHDYFYAKEHGLLKR